jgi:hypothetical protein
LDQITGPLQRLFSDVHEQVFKLQEERDEWKIKYMKARETIDKYKKLLEKLSRSDELQEDNKKLIINETKHEEVDELDLEDKREPQRILYNMNRAKSEANNEHLEYSVIYLSDSEEVQHGSKHEHVTGDEGHVVAEEGRDEDQPHSEQQDEFELFRHTPQKRRVSMRDEDEDAKYGNDEPATHGHDEERRPKKQYKYVAAVRKKEDREQLTGHECEQCAQFYTAIYGNEGAPHANTHVHAHHSHGHKSKEELIGHVSRHKQLYTPPHTPEGYWDLSFPHTSQGEGE